MPDPLNPVVPTTAPVDPTVPMHKEEQDPVIDANQVDPAAIKPDAPPITDPKKELNQPQIPEPNVPPSPLRKDEMEPSAWRQVLHVASQFAKQGIRGTLIEAVDQIHRRLYGVPQLKYSRLADNLHVGGQYDEDGWARLQKERGVTAVVNMRAEYDESDHGFGPDMGKYCHLPTPDGYAPKLEDIRKGVGFMRAMIAAGETVYVHCWEGVGRAPTMIAAYLVSTGITPSEAWGKIRAVRPFIRPSVGQLAVVDAFAYEWGNRDAVPLTQQVIAQVSGTPLPTPAAP